MITDQETPATSTDVVIERLVAGGRGLGRLEDGRVALIASAVPGDRCRIGELRGSTVDRFELLTPSPHRWTHPCPAAASGCGGCDLAAIEPRALVEFKLGIVADSLRRLGRVDATPVAGPPLPIEGFRTSMRFLVADGSLALRRHGSHDPVDTALCRVAHPLMEDLIALEWPSDVDEVSLRVGARTGERMVVVHGGTASSLASLLPENVKLAHLSEQGSGRHRRSRQGPQVQGPVIYEEVADVRFRISPHSFFQSRQDGAEVLVSLVNDALDQALGVRPRARVLDLCSGVGLFAGTALQRHPDWQVTAVEPSRSSIEDARINLDGRRARIVRSSMEKFNARTVDAVIADPPRSGLGRAGAKVIEASRAEVVVLVSCDAACAGRDARLLIDLGYSLDSATVVDMFPHTHHVEVVSVFRR